MEFNVTDTPEDLPGARRVRYIKMDMLMSVTLDLQVLALPMAGAGG